MPAAVSRTRAVVRWLAPSVTAAALAALIGGGYEALRAGATGTTWLTSLGFASAVAFPLGLAVAIGVRLLWLGWAPAQLVQQLTDDDGVAAPLAAWLVVALLGAGAIAWATYAVIATAAAHTTFKATVLAALAPGVMALAALAIMAGARPALRLLTVAFRRLGRSWLTPRVVLLGLGSAVVIGLGLTWWLAIAPRLGFIDLSIFRLPTIALPVLGGAHWVGRRLAPRWHVGGALASAALVIAVVGYALAQRHQAPVVVLDAWSRPTIAAEVIERSYDLEAMRGDITFASAGLPRRPDAPLRDVILITIDTVRADRTPMYGGAADMPRLAAMAAAGTVFERALAPGNVTRRSIPSIATGLAPTRIRGKVAGWALRLDPRHILAAERFRAGGYRTAGFLCCESFWAPRHRLGLGRGLDELTLNYDAEALASQALAWYRAHKASGDPRPVFVWLHFIEPHNWARGDLGTNATERRAAYDRSLTAVDASLGRLLEGLPAPSSPTAPIVAVTSDHGEGLGDHGAPYHSTTLYDSELRVPWLVSGPGVAIRRVTPTVSLVSMAPTLLDLAGFDPSAEPSFDAASLAPLLRGETDALPPGYVARASMMQDRSTARWAEAIAVDQYKLIETARGFELYDLRADPGERRNLIDQAPEVADRLRALLRTARARDRLSPFASQVMTKP